MSTSVIDVATRAIRIIAELRDSAKDLEWRSRLIELQSLLLALQEANFALEADKRTLQQELDSLRAERAQDQLWQDRAKDFPLTDHQGVIVRRGKSNAVAHEPIHSLCPYCFDKRVYAPINPCPGTLHSVCPACQSRFP